MCSQNFHLELVSLYCHQLTSNLRTFRLLDQYLYSYLRERTFPHMGHHGYGHFPSPGSRIFKIIEPLLDTQFSDSLCLLNPMHAFLKITKLNRILYTWDAFEKIIYSLLDAHQFFFRFKSCTPNNDKSLKSITMVGYT